jgi:hypothetical protein
MYIILIRILKIIFKFNLGVRDGVGHVRKRGQGQGGLVVFVWVI